MLRARRSLLLMLTSSLWVVEATGCGPMDAMAGGASNGNRDEILVGPVLQNATSDRVSVMWETRDGMASVVDYGLTEQLGTLAYGHIINGPAGRTIHHADMTVLLPDTTYYYRVVGPGETARINSFRTPPQPGSLKPFKFAVYSDCQQQPQVHRQIVDQGIYGSLDHEGDISDQLGFVLVAGDIVQNGNLYNEYRERFFDPIQNVSSSVPYYTAIGNHEENSQHYFNYLNLPGNGTPGYEEHWYSFQYGNAHVIGLDTNGAYSLQAQLDWLNADLSTACANPDVGMVFAFFHHPYKSELWVPGEHAYSGQIVAALEEQLKACNKPGAYFFGHTHGYSRGQSRDADLYWVNVGSAGGHLDRWDEYPQADYPEFQKSFDEYGVLMVEVNPDGQPGFAAERLTFGDETIARRGDVQDRFAVAVSNEPPLQPTIRDATWTGTSVVVTGSPFSDDDSALHLEAEWQLAPTASFDRIVDQRWLRHENWYKDVDTNAGLNMTHVTFDDVATAASPWVRVRYRDDQLRWSLWSSPFEIRRESGP